MIFNGKCLYNLVAKGRAHYCGTPNVGYDYLDGVYYNIDSPDPYYGRYFVHHIIRNAQPGFNVDWAEGNCLALGQYGYGIYKLEIMYNLGSLNQIRDSL